MGTEKVKKNPKSRNLEDGLPDFNNILYKYS